MVLTEAENRFGRSWCCSGKPAAGELLPQITVLTPLKGLHGSGPVSVPGKIGSFHVLYQAVRPQPQICWESCQAWRSPCSDSTGGGQHETAVLQSRGAWPGLWLQEAITRVPCPQPLEGMVWLEPAPCLP